MDMFTGTTSSVSRTASGKVAVSPWSANRFANAPWPAAKAVTLSQQDPTDSESLA
jgi:hypothetical protein